MPISAPIPERISEENIGTNAGKKAVDNSDDEELEPEPDIGPYVERGREIG